MQNQRCAKLLYSYLLEIIRSSGEKNIVEKGYKMPLLSLRKIFGLWLES